MPTAYYKWKLISKNDKRHIATIFARDEAEAIVKAECEGWAVVPGPDYTLTVEDACDADERELRRQEHG